MDWLPKSLDFFAKYAWALATVSMLLLAMPNDAADQIGLLSIREEYRGHIWIALIFSIVLSLGSLLSFLKRSVIDDWLKEHLAKKRQAEENEARIDRLVRRLSSLNAGERMWLQYCLYHNEQTLSAQRTDTRAQSLLNKGILSEGSGSILDLPFHIQDYVWDYLNENRGTFLPEHLIDNSEFKNRLTNFRRSLWPSHWR